MFDWIEKVVPQPPVKIHVSVVGEKDAPMEQSAAVDGPGLAKLLPGGGCCNPAEASLQGEDLGTVDLWLLRERTGQGLVFWLSQRLQKAIPQLPAAQTQEASIDIPEETEIQSFHEEEEELAIAALESEESEEESDMQCSSDSHGGKAFTWLMEGLGKIMPQPEKKRQAEEMSPGTAAEGSAELKGSGRVTSQSEPLPASPPSSARATGSASADQQSYLSLPLFPQRLQGNGAQSLFKCFLRGLEKVVPQPVTKAKQDGQETKSTVQGRGEESPCSVSPLLLRDPMGAVSRAHPQSRLPLRQDWVKSQTFSVQRDAEEDDEVLVEVRSWTYLAECDLGSPPSPERKHGGDQQERKREASNVGTLGQLTSSKVEAGGDIANPLIQVKAAATAAAPTLVAPAVPSPTASP